MPGGDRTGPRGMGPMTGRTAGYCASSVFRVRKPDARKRFWNRFRKRWRSLGGGGGRGWRNMFYATGQPGWMRFGGYAAPYGYPAPYQAPNPEMEKQFLKSQADALQAEMDAIRKRLADIETGTTEQ